MKTVPEPTATERVDARPAKALAWMNARGFRLLFVLDAVALYASMVLINLARFGLSWPSYPVPHYLVGFGLATAIHLTIGYLVGLYEREPQLGYRPWLPRIVIAMAIGVAIEGLVVHLTGRYLMPRGNLIALLVAGSVALVGTRRLSRTLYRRRHGPPRVLLVGPADQAEIARQHLNESDRDVHVVGVLPTTRGLVHEVRAKHVGDVLLLDLEAFGDIFPQPLTWLEDHGVGVHQRVGARETLLGLRSVRQIAGMPFARLETHAMKDRQLRIKRLFDLVLLVLASPFVLLALGFAATWVLVCAGRPILYRQVRVGYRSRPFTLVKFRTMVVDAELDGPRLAVTDDPRVVPSLRWMRTTRFDELPQLWNVARGQMSLVGPRPERPERIAEFEHDTPGYERRHETPPGLTGLAQVYGRYHTAPDHKLGYDLQYMVNWSPILDLQILLRTAWVVLTGRI